MAFGIGRAVRCGAENLDIQITWRELFLLEDVLHVSAAGVRRRIPPKAAEQNRIYIRESSVGAAFPRAAPTSF